uniref:ORF6 n=1 Tax=Carrot yellow leaf virus TaxID=656190 RepID=A0A0A0P3K3_9CLOS|nr:ORF6 [Carrot yellow leaf virus]
MSTPMFAGHSWGCLFKRFYGVPVWKDYLSNTASSNATYVLNTYRFSSGHSISASDVAKAGRSSAVYEFYLLLKSETIYKWCETCGIGIQTAFSDYDTNVNSFRSNMLIDVDVKTVGCRFSLSDLEVALRPSHPLEIRDKTFLEHCWVLSNSCGEIIDPLDIKRFKSITFGDSNTLGKTDETLMIGSSVGDYLSHCLTVLARSKLPSSAGETKMKDDWLGHCITYFSATDLNYSSKEKIPLLTGIIYELIDQHKMFLSSYANNVKNFSVFLGKIVPTIESIWTFKWLKKPTDHRLLFEFSLSDLNKSASQVLSLNDMTVVLESKLNLLERVIHHSNIDSLKEVVDAILKDENPNIDGETLWICFHCYYGQHRTAAERVQARPEYYEPPFSLKKADSKLKISFIGVEKLFTTLQGQNPGINVRRQFCGRVSHEAIFVFKKMGLRFPTIANVVIPPELAYLNLDYYKWVDTSQLKTEEEDVLAKLHREVDAYCTARLVSTRGGNALRPPKYKIVNNTLKTITLRDPTPHHRDVERTYDRVTRRFSRESRR